MNLSKAAWLVSLPLSAAGMLLAHESAWELVEHHHAAGEGHGYLQVQIATRVSEFDEYGKTIEVPIR